MEDNIANMSPSEGYHDVPLRATPHMYKEFQKSAIYHDIMNLVEDRISLLQSDLEGAETIEEVRDLQGRIAELRSVLAYPEYLAQRAEMEREQEQNEEE